MAEPTDGKHDLTAEDIAQAALAWLWHSRHFFAPPEIDDNGVAFHDACRRLGGRFAAEVEQVERAEREQRAFYEREREDDRKRSRAVTDERRERNRLRPLVYERDGHACVRCGATDHLSLDHVHPQSAGGETTMENLQTLCRTCNSSKGARVGA